MSGANRRDPAQRDDFAQGAGTGTHPAGRAWPRIAGALWRFATSPAYRNYLLLRWRRPKNLFQLSSLTWTDRYPDLFQFARDELGDGTALRLLSFGCSTGEEVFTLRRYFSQARIKGLDINAASIGQCRRRLRECPDSGIDFEVADTTSREPSNAYDAAFCMAVFRDGSLADPGIDRCDHLIAFSRFSAQIDDIARCLKPGGLLLIVHANFRFTDTPVAKQFDLAFRSSFAESLANPTPIFDTGNRRTNQINCQESAFRKT